MNTSIGSLKGKIALVTGGSRGIGAAIVRRLSADGAAVAFTYASSPERAQVLAAEVDAAGGRALAIRADSADPAAVERSVAETVQAFGRIDILVNNAGILVHKPLADTLLDDFERIMAVNVRAQFVAIQAAQKQMGDGGRIVNIGSMVADRAGSPGSRCTR
jgi:3-oxoacyl-[acyl-carrier protein] reductase